MVTGGGTKSARLVVNEVLVELLDVLRLLVDVEVVLDDEELVERLELLDVVDKLELDDDDELLVDSLLDD